MVNVDSIEEVAARWVVRANAAPLNAGEQTQLERWLEADPRHLGAYVRTRAQWENLDRLAALNGPATLSGSPPEAVSEVTTRRNASLSRRQMLAAGMAALAVGSAGLSLLILRDGRQYVSGIGEVRRLTLADGSTMLLNTDTEVRVQLGKRRRDIQLVRGEALFEVFHDSARPFVVTARETAVRAVGTAFAVRLEPNAVNVTVTEGVVEVGAAQLMRSDPAATKSQPFKGKRVAANERIVIARVGSEEVKSIPPAEAVRQLAWRQGQVSFDGEPLSVAVAEINRHNQRQIVIDAAASLSTPVVGVFSSTDPESFAAAAAAALRLRSVPDGDVIRLEARIPASKN